jgi:hypothetical protein
MSHRSHPTVTYKTIKLSKGKHTSPEHGACVMELASMLAGEPFSDQPQTASPVIAAFLRVYNDSLDDRRRQDLYRCAAEVVGTRGSAVIERKRLERLVSWADEMRRARRSLFAGLRSARIEAQGLDDAEAAALSAVKAIGRLTAERHEQALALVEELCAIGTDQRPDHEFVWPRHEPGPGRTPMPAA